MWNFSTQSSEIFLQQSLMDASTILLNVVSIVLTAVDIISDVILAVDYCATDNPWWCGLTWTFIAAPIVAFPIIFCCCSETGGGRDDIRTPSKLKFWKCTEICFESGPQLILQLYILALQDQNTSSAVGTLPVLKVF